jgi:hypothetical protein
MRGGVLSVMLFWIWNLGFQMEQVIDEGSTRDNFVDANNNLV